MNVKTEWHRAPDFAEFAEALGIPTDCIMAARPNDDPITVLYTDEPDEHGFDPDEPIMVAVLRRDGDGIPRLLDRPQPTRLTWREIEANVERAMEQFDDHA